MPAVVIVTVIVLPEKLPAIVAGAPPEASAACGPGAAAAYVPCALKRP